MQKIESGVDGNEPALRVHDAGPHEADKVVQCAVLAGGDCVGNRESRHGWR